MQVEVLDIDNKKYMVLNEISDNDETYLYLSNINDPKDFLIRKLDKNNKEYLINLDDKEEFKKAMGYFEDINEQ